MGGFMPTKYTPGRVETGPGGKSFKLNPNPTKTMRPGDATPGVSGGPMAAPGMPGGPGFVTNSGGGIAGATSAPAPGGGGGGGGGAPGAPGAPLQNYAQANPNMDQALADYRARMAGQAGKEDAANPLLMEQVNNLRGQMSHDQTARATDQAGSHIQDFTSGMRNAAEQRAARTGRTQGFQGAALDESAQRAQAAAAAGIQMNEQQRKDNLTLGGQNIMAAPGQEALQREGMTNSLISGQMGQAGAGANLGLQQQQLGLQQWQAQNQNQNEQQRLAMQQQQQYQQMLMQMLQGGY